MGHSRIGERYQVSNRCIPLSDTWRKELLAGKEEVVGGSAMESKAAAVAENDQIWDKTLSEEARSQGEPMDKYIESLHTFQRARGVMTLHQSAYKVTVAERKFNSQAAADIPFPNKPEPAGQPCKKPHTMSEGKPLSQHEQEAFNEAIQEHRKQWPKIAKAIGILLLKG